MPEWVNKDRMLKALPKEWQEHVLTKTDRILSTNEKMEVHLVDDTQMQGHAAYIDEKGRVFINVDEAWVMGDFVKNYAITKAFSYHEVAHEIHSPPMKKFPFKDELDRMSMNMLEDQRIETRFVLINPGAALFFFALVKLKFNDEAENWLLMHGRRFAFNSVKKADELIQSYETTFRNKYGNEYVPKFKRVIDEYLLLKRTETDAMWVKIQEFKQLLLDSGVFKLDQGGGISQGPGDWQPPIGDDTDRPNQKKKVTRMDKKAGQKLKEEMEKEQKKVKNSGDSGNMPGGNGGCSCPDCNGTNINIREIPQQVI